jgi:hypothetical protein
MSPGGANPHRHTSATIENDPSGSVCAGGGSGSGRDLRPLLHLEHVWRREVPLELVRDDPGGVAAVRARAHRGLMNYSRLNGSRSSCGDNTNCSDACAR